MPPKRTYYILKAMSGPVSRLCLRKSIVLGQSFHLDRFLSRYIDALTWSTCSTEKKTKSYSFASFYFAFSTQKRRSSESVGLLLSATARKLRKRTNRINPSCTENYLWITYGKCIQYLWKVYSISIKRKRKRRGENEKKRI